MQQNPLQLRDFLEGYEFRVKCNSCGFNWIVDPNHVTEMSGAHLNMYLPEIERTIRCQRCHKHDNRITILIEKPQHHFVAGLP